MKHVFLDLGFAPLSNAYLDTEDLRRPEQTYPLKLYVCHYCWLVQTEDYTATDQLFGPHYAYFSSVSTSWLAHAQRYAEMIIRRLKLDAQSLVIEVASNDGYLLKNFVKAGIPCLGIEPSTGTAAVAEAQGIPVIHEFFGEALGKRLSVEGRQADLIIGNNVYAHVPDINDFTRGLKLALRPGGTITLEFPHFMTLVKDALFDTVYHEHFSYLSLYTVKRIFRKTELRVFHVEQILTHGGSLRVYGCHREDGRNTTRAVATLLAKEEKWGLRRLGIYHDFQTRADRIKNDLLAFLIETKRAGKRVAAYGAAAKGNTLLNYTGIKPDLLPYVCDAAPSKQGKYLPGTHIPILSPDVLGQRQPDYVLILPWNIADEIVAQHRYIKKWGGQFVVALPELHIIK